MNTDKAIRDQLVKFLDWGDAHANFDAAVKGVPPKLRGVVPEKAEHSLWQLVEHLRLAQEDILDFCRNPKYEEKAWPDDYWPKSPVPPGDAAWDASVKAFHRDLEEFGKLAGDATVDLSAKIPHGSGQTILREVLLVQDHNAYHIGQMILVRRMLGVWPAK